MDELAFQVQAALLGRYRIERQLGSGGMGVVYLATDERTGQKLALKVLRPVVGAAIGPERFLREIRIAAQLAHPGVLPLTESGEAAGLLYFTMPFVDGHTLRELLERDGPLPLEAAVELFGQIAAAIAHAHEQGIVHRDVKPDNVLLTGRTAVVADFGIARVLAQGGAERVTSTGVALGTPAYMSPEQVSLERVDGRSDQYSLACVLYEMIAGAPPFPAADSRAVLARHALDPVPPLRTVRPAVPAELDAAISRALAKQPADRWPSVASFAAAVARGARAPVERQPPMIQTRRLIAAAAGAIVLTAAILAVHYLRGPGNAPLDPELIAVAPLGAGGILPAGVTPGSLVRQLESGINGVSGWRAITLAADGGEPRRAARRLQAGLLLTGQFSTVGDSISIDALLQRSADGRAVARVDGLVTSRDRIATALDRVGLTLLARAAGEPDFRIPGVVARPVEAVQAYLGGMARYRRGRYREAADAFERALTGDSTFAISGLMAYYSNLLGSRPERTPKGYWAAFGHSDQLAPEDRMVLRALAGPRAPLPATHLEWLRARRRVADSLPHSLQAVLMLAEELHEWGPATGYPNPLQQTFNLLQAALATDSALAPVLERLIDLSASLGDTASVRRLGRIHAGLDSLADRRDYVRWRVAMALGDSGRAALLTSLLPSAPSAVLDRIVSTAQLDGTALEDAVAAVAEIGRRAKSPAAAWFADLGARELDHNLGRPGDAPPWPPGKLFTDASDVLLQVVQTLYWEGDSVAALRMVRERTPSADGPLPNPSAEDPRYMDICVVGLWRAAHADWDRVRIAARRLGRARDAEQVNGAWYIPICRAILEAQMEGALGLPGATAALARLDTLAFNCPPTNVYAVFAANLTVAALKEAAGDLNGALAAVRRRSLSVEAGAVGLSTLLREEGRLAALAGEREAAIDAYAKYLALRRHPEPRLAPEVARVRAALTALRPDRP